ncbi:hypothetical protein [Pseudomonas sp.]|jgi:hypothetical protein|uniref:hypothetical protein n=1 Tax=Pseudomonas sp. TaxID=306 RepID=UPI001A0529A9|nr:hypothetical protein [Pseudomonas sp.]MBF0677188.1 hypothetical protein [Pseudomonas sp.]
MLKRISFIALLSITSATYAMIDEYQLEGLVGWTIIASKQIEGRIDENGEKSDDFEGCDHGTRIIFTDGTGVTCNSYGYQYAYMPKAIILGSTIKYKGKDVTIYKMLVQGQIYDVY